MVNIDISDITAFIVAAELKSISAAAVHLNHLQSNLTVKIKKIENNYNYQLFSRNSKGVELTPKGKTVYHYYKKIIQLWEETQNSILSEGNLLKFGINSTMRGYQFAHVIQSLYQSYPNVSLTFKTGITPNLEKQVCEGHLDLAFIFGTPENKQLNYSVYCTEELVLVGKELTGDLEHDLSRQKILCLAEDCCYMTIFEEMYRHYNIPLTEKVFISDIEDLISFSQLGLGISLVAKGLVKKHFIQHYIEIPIEFRNILGYIVSRKNYAFTNIEKHFISQVQAILIQSSQHVI